ncbi:MAG: transposase [Bacteroidales bacterium]|nr:transposase [Bacteroidales bacterium]MCD8393398.1 transposase [Bacteroidales bacterium]
MPKSYDNLLMHIVYAVKYRAAVINPLWRKQFHQVMGGIVKKLGAVPLAIGGTDDHIHLLISYNGDLRPKDFVRDSKTSSTDWINRHQVLPCHFHWQKGSGRFSVSYKLAKGTIDYINNQEEHHKGMTFLDEYRMLLKRHGIEYDERDLFQPLE